jgi:murein DD-endopeptidase MepM/ murein hydrolase activator NlpD
MPQNKDWRRRKLSWRVTLQRISIRFRKGILAFGHWFFRDIPWRRFLYVFMGALIVLTIWGLTIYRPSLSKRLELPKGDNIQAPSETEPEVTALSRLESEVASLKQRISQLNELELKDISNFTPAQFGLPALGKIVEVMGWVRNGDEWRYHDGIDILAVEGSHVLAAADGVVESIKSQTGLGTVVIINHGNGWDSRYGHLQGVLVTIGQKIPQGTVIGYSSARACQGNPGFHFSIYLKGNPVDPAGIISGLN